MYTRLYVKFSQSNMKLLDSCIFIIELFNSKKAKTLAIYEKEKKFNKSQLSHREKSPRIALKFNLPLNMNKTRDSPSP